MKTDNKSLRLKVEIRKRLLKETGLKPLRILDLYAGEGLIWKEVGKNFKFSSYTPVDKAPRLPGTIKATVDEHFLQAFDMSQFNVVDVDTYGEPWLAWEILFPKIQHPTLFFLTHGAVSTRGGCQISKLARQIMGIPKHWNIPQKRELAQLADKYILLRKNPMARIIKGYQVPLTNVTYYGLLCSPNQYRLLEER